MRKLILMSVVLLGVVFSAGCVSPGIGERPVYGKNAFYATDGEAPVFLLLSDGDFGSIGCTNILGAWPTYYGGREADVTFTADTEAVRINDTEYSFGEGRVFLVSVGDDELKVEQLQIPLEENVEVKVHGIAATNEEVRNFLDDSSAEH